MRILYVSERPPYPFFLGGAARSAHYLLSILVRDFGVDALAVGSGEFAGSRWSCPAESDFSALGIKLLKKNEECTAVECGYPVEVRKDFLNGLGRIIESFAPDVVWTQLDGAERVAQIALGMSRRVAVFLRDAEDPPAKLRVLADMGCCLLCNSHFMAQRIRRITGKKARVIYPSLESRFGVTGNPQGVVTMINPHPVKGVETFFGIARRMPRENFLLVESWALSQQADTMLKGRLSELPNVRFLRRSPDVSEIYRQTKLLLVPSIWEEAFGRVVIEAQSCHIPVIASNRGGLREAVGDGGICLDDYKNPDVWVATIEETLADRSMYDQLADRAEEHAGSESFTPAHAARLFFDSCHDDTCFRKPTFPRLRPLLQRFEKLGEMLR